MTSRILLRSLLTAVLALTFAAARPALADSGHARIVRLSLVQGDVRFTRDVKGDPLASDKAVWEAAVSNLPVRQGYVLATDKGRAEVEFENGAMAFLSENTVLEFYDLSLHDGTTTTRLILRQGTASFYVNPSSSDYFSVTGGDFTVEAEGRTSFRLDNFDDGSIVNVVKGRVSVLRKEQTTVLSKDQSLSIKAGDESSMTVGRVPEQPDEFDQWVSGQIDSVSKATTATMQYTGSPYFAAGFGSLYSYGSWFDCGAYGYGWRPFGAGYGWSPFTNGQWTFDPVFGWTWVSFQPWGWAPYHYGGWLFDSSCGGWFYSPPIPYVYGPSVPRRRIPPVHPPRPVYHAVTAIFVRNKGNLGFVPMHPLDTRGKTPRNLEHGILSPSGTSDLSGRRVISSEPGQKWQALKSAPKDAFSNSLTPAAPPLRVSRSLLESGVGARGVSMGKGSSITYDATEHRFVNSNSAPVSTTKLSGEKTEASSGSVAAGHAALPNAGPVQTPAVSGSSRAATSVPTRAVAPPAPSRGGSSPRTMAPPPASHSSAGRYEPSGRGGGDASSRTQSAPRASAPAPALAPRASAPAPSGGGRPH